jgi:hypothetical protein
MLDPSAFANRPREERVGVTLRPSILLICSCYIHPASEFQLREPLGSSIGDEVQRNPDAN